MLLFCCVHALEQSISTLFSDKAIVPLNDLCDQLCQKMTENWSPIEHNNTHNRIMNGKKNNVSGSSLFYAP